MSTKLQRQAEKNKRYIDKQKGKLMPAPVKKISSRGKKKTTNPKKNRKDGPVFRNV